MASAACDTFEVQSDYVEISDIRICTDLSQLTSWLLNAEEVAADIKVQIDANREAGRDQDSVWFRRAAGALTANRLTEHHCRRRIIALNGEIPATIKDERGRRIDELQRLVGALRSRMADMASEQSAQVPA